MSQNSGNDRTDFLSASENRRVASLLVITGPPGAGKSTVAALVAKRSTPSVLVDGDAFFAFLDQGAMVSHQSSRCRSLARQRQAVVMENEFRSDVGLPLRADPARAGLHRDGRA
jgi:adenylylsulfate kinase-like enzyme